MIAYVLITTKPTYEYTVYQMLIRNKSVQDVNPLFGKYDIIIKVEGTAMEDLLGIIDDIRRLEGVVTIKTLTGWC